MSAATRLLIGDCLERMRELDDESIDAVVTDPPYGIGFIGHEWDQPGYEGRRNGSPAPFASGRPARDGGVQGSGGSLKAGTYDLSPTANRRFQAWCEAWGAEVLRVLKPGGHAVVFGSPRTYHRLAAGLEDAGFEIRDSLMWLFGSGFPKSRNLDGDRTGWGTALKPAYEPIVLARKPLGGTVAATVAEHGTGALNIDGCRIGTTKGVPASPRARQDRIYGAYGAQTGKESGHDPDVGRWPANVLLDAAAAVLLDEQSGELMSGANPTRRGSDKFGNAYGDFAGRTECVPARGVDRGGASRFFYCAKASTVEREAGLDGLATSAEPLTTTPTSTLQHGRSGGERVDDRVPERSPRANVHPTVKPIDVMRWLVRLITPPGGLVLDPFTGSGTTGAAAALEGARFVGIERDESYAAIAEQRIAFWSQWDPGTETAAAVDQGTRDARRQEAGELSMLDLLVPVPVQEQETR